jgi:hypothetical protein
MRLIVSVGLVAAVLSVVVRSAGAATTRACAPVLNPYPNTRYSGVNLSHIRATGVSCTTARSVAKGAHRRALAMTPTPSGIRRFTWNGWHVTGDLKPASDVYVATRGTKRMRWRF